MRPQHPNQLLLASLVVTTGLSAAPSLQPSTGAQGPTRTQITAALEAGGLHEAARLNGGHYTRVMDYNPHPLRFGAIDGLVRLAHDVVIGDIVDGECHINGMGGLYITTEYKVRVSQSLLGDTAEGTDIVVSVLGGKVVFEDGLSASVETPGFDHPRAGEQVLLFLNPVAANDQNMSGQAFGYATGYQLFRPAGNARGVFGLPTKETEGVHAKSRSSDSLGVKLLSKDAKTFVNDVRDAIRRLDRLKPKKAATR